MAKREHSPFQLGQPESGYYVKSLSQQKLKPLVNHKTCMNDSAIHNETKTTLLRKLRIQKINGCSPQHDSLNSPMKRDNSPLKKDNSLRDLTKIQLKKSSKFLTLPKLTHVPSKSSILSTSTESPQPSPPPKVADPKIDEEDFNVWDESDMKERGLKEKIEALPGLEQLAVLFKYRYESTGSTLISLSKVNQAMNWMAQFGNRSVVRKLDRSTACQELLCQDFTKTSQENTKRYILH